MHGLVGGARLLSSAQLSMEDAYNNAAAAAKNAIKPAVDVRGIEWHGNAWRRIAAFDLTSRLHNQTVERGWR